MTHTCRLLPTGFLLLALLAGCSDPTGSSAAFTTAVLAGGDGQTALVGTALPLPLRVRVLEGTAARAGVRVAWQSSAGALIVESNETNVDGDAFAGWVLGSPPGPLTATASVDGVATPVIFHATALDYVTATMDPSSEDQSGVVGTQLGKDLAITAWSGGVRQANVSVVWSTTSGTVTPGSALTDGNGVARARWTLGPLTGPQTATVTVARTRGGPLVFHASATLLPGTIIRKGEGLDSQFVPVNFPPATLRVTVQDAYGNEDTATPIAWSVVSGPATVEPIVWSDRAARVRPTGTVGVATVRAALPGAGPSVDFTVTMLPLAPMVTLEVGAQTGFLSGLNGTRPAIDTIPIGSAMTWFLSDEDLDSHAIASVGLPAFAGGVLGYGGTVRGLTVTFSAAGTYRYEDPYWPGTIGTLVVQ